MLENRALLCEPWKGEDGCGEGEMVGNEERILRSRCCNNCLLAVGTASAT